MDIFSDTRGQYLLRLCGQSYGNACPHPCSVLINACALEMPQKVVPKYRHNNRNFDTTCRAIGTQALEASASSVLYCPRKCMLQIKLFYSILLHYYFDQTVKFRTRRALYIFRTRRPSTAPLSGGSKKETRERCSWGGARLVPCPLPTERTDPRKKKKGINSV